MLGVSTAAGKNNNAGAADANEAAGKDVPHRLLEEGDLLAFSVLHSVEKAAGGTVGGACALGASSWAISAESWFCWIHEVSVSAGLAGLGVVADGAAVGALRALSVVEVVVNVASGAELGSGAASAVGAACVAAAVIEVEAGGARCAVVTVAVGAAGGASVAEVVGVARGDADSVLGSGIESFNVAIHANLTSVGLFVSGKLLAAGFALVVYLSLGKGRNGGNDEKRG